MSTKNQTPKVNGFIMLVVAVMVGAIACYSFYQWYPSYKAEKDRAEAVRDSIAASLTSVPYHV